MATNDDATPSLPKFTHEEILAKWPSYCRKLAGVMWANREVAEDAEYAEMLRMALQMADAEFEQVRADANYEEYLRNNEG